jgi:hypothetical protein
MATAIEFEYHGGRELATRMDNVDSVINVSLNEGLRKIGRLIVPNKGIGPLANATPKRSGKLARSTFFRIVGGIKNQWLEVLQPAQSPDGAFYGGYVRDGTPAHVILPRKAKALRFVIQGRVVFAMKVNHPGTSPNPYHKRVLAMLTPSIQQITNRIGVKVTAYLAGR